MGEGTGTETWEYTALEGVEGGLRELKGVEGG